MRAALFWLKPGLVLIKRPLPEKKRHPGLHFHPHATNAHVSGPLLTLT